jgi:imidazolonepropionase-like amidohydrolase
MMRAMYSPLALGLAALALATAPFVLDADTPAPAQEAAATRLAIRAGTVHTMAGDPITDGVILIENGLVTAVGPAASVRIPAGVRVLEARVAVPGLIDAHSCVGLAGWLNIEHDKDEVDRTGSAQPELRAIDAYNTREPLVKWLRGFGVTTVHTGHGPLALISGQTMITKTFGDTVEDAVLVPEAMVAACMTSAARGDGGPGTRAKVMAELRQHLMTGAKHAAAMAKAEADDEIDAPDRDLRKEALARVANGTTPLMVTAHEAADLINVLRLHTEFPDVRFVIDGAAEAPLVLDELVEAGLPIIVHPTMYRAGGDTKDLSMETAKVLIEAGLTVAMQSGYEGYVPRTRVVLFEAAIAARYGVPFERALGMITIDAARLLGVDDRIGSLEVGKHGDVALFDGDPFEYTSHCVGTVIEGEVVATGEREL